MPAIVAQCSQLAEQAVRERRTNLGYLEREERAHRLIERAPSRRPPAAHESLEDFDFARNPKVSAQQIYEPAHRPSRAAAVIFAFDAGTDRRSATRGVALFDP
jgi:hypothetical protein